MPYLKNISKISLLLIMTFLLSACGGTVDETPTNNSEQETTQTQTKEQETSITEEVEVNTKPQAEIIDKLTRENGIVINFSAETYDAENDQLTYKWEDGDTILSTEKFFIKNDFTDGEHNITFTVTDAKGASTSETMSVTILPSNDINDTPTVNDQNIVTDEDTEVSFTIDANDVEDDQLTMRITSNPLHGDLTGTFPNFTYTPDENYRGEDSLKYRVNDGNSVSTEATISFVINNVNDAPTVHGGDDAKMRIAHTKWFSATAHDNDGIISSYTWSENGTILSQDPSFQYTPKTAGIHQLKITVTDNENASTTDTVLVDVTNKLPLLVIRIEFNNFIFHSDATTWSDKIFSTAEGDLNDYFNEISYGRLQFEKATEHEGVANDGIITVKLNRDHPGNSQYFIYPDAIKIADDYIDFSQYDIDKNGAVSFKELQILFIVAGGENATGLYPGVWAHASSFNNGVSVDNVKVIEYGTYGRYCTCGERHKYGNSDHDATIGIIAHELAHTSFGLTDLYDTTGVSEGIGNFGLMGSGNWGRESDIERPGATPVPMTAWSKIQSKFVEPIEISTSSTVTFENTVSSDFKPYKIKTDRENEYFLAENRANLGYDKGLFILQNGQYFQGGLLITHIDEDIEDNDNVNHKKVDVEEANNAGLDNNETHRGHINNLYFSGNRDSFTPYTSPNSNLYNATESGISITNISDSGSTMSADIEIRR